MQIAQSLQLSFISYPYHLQRILKLFIKKCKVTHATKRVGIKERKTINHGNDENKN